MLLIRAFALHGVLANEDPVTRILNCGGHATPLALSLGQLQEKICNQEWIDVGDVSVAALWRLGDRIASGAEE